MKRPGYREAIDWIASNDDCYFLADDEPIMSVTVCMIRDLFDVPQDRLIRDLRRSLKRIYPNHEALHGEMPGRGKAKE